MGIRQEGRDAEEETSTINSNASHSCTARYVRTSASTFHRDMVTFEMICTTLVANPSIAILTHSTWMAVPKIIVCICGTLPTTISYGATRATWPLFCRAPESKPHSHFSTIFWCHKYSIAAEVLLFFLIKEGTPCPQEYSTVL